MHMTLYHIHSFLQTSQQFRGLRHVGDTYHAHCSLSVGTVMELSTAEGLQATSLAPETAICHLISSSRQPSEAKESLLPGQFNVVFTFQGKNLEPGYIKTVQLRSDRAGWEPGLGIPYTKACVIKYQRQVSYRNLALWRPRTSNKE